MKALGVGLGDFDFHDVEVVAPRERRAVARGARPGAATRTDRGVTGWLLSLSHTEATAMAVVIAVGV